MTHDQNPEPDEQRMIALLRAIQDGVPPVDPTLLSDLRERTIDAFEKLPIEPESTSAPRRGANAARVSFTSGIELTLGPGTLLECVSPGQVRLHGGITQVTAPGETESKSKTAFTLLAPRNGSRTFRPGEKSLVRVDRAEQLVSVADTHTRQLLQQLPQQ